MLSTPVAIGNITDSEAFVRHCIKKAGSLILTTEQTEDLMAEGLRLLWVLWRNYDPARDGDEHSDQATHGFFGYALYLLPKRLSAAWHNSQPHHLLRTQPDGTRRWEYYEREANLDDPNHQQQLVAPEPATSSYGTVGYYYPPGNMASVVAMMKPEDQSVAWPMLLHLEQGYECHELPAVLAVSPIDIKQTRTAIGSAMWELNQEATP